MGLKPHWRASASPISAGYVYSSICSRMGASASRVSAARLGASGTAPNSRALLTVSRPSLPFKPTRPPIPAIGLTIRPILWSNGLFPLVMFLLIDSPARDDFLYVGQVF